MEVVVYASIRDTEVDGDADVDDTVRRNNNNNNNNNNNKDNSNDLLDADSVVCSFIAPSTGSSNGKNRCLHHRLRSKCKDCGGGSICQHQRQRSKCKDCGGGSICQHQRQRSTCKDCGV